MVDLVAGCVSAGQARLWYQCRLPVSDVGSIKICGLLGGLFYLEGWEL